VVCQLCRCVGDALDAAVTPVDLRVHLRQYMRYKQAGQDTLKAVQQYTSGAAHIL
jgi:hypothetical protein